MTQPTDKVRPTPEPPFMVGRVVYSPDYVPRNTDFLVDAPHTVMQNTAINNTQLQATIEEQSAEIERLKGEIAHLREVAAIQHEYEEVCEFYIQCSPTPKGLREWSEALPKDIP